MEELHNKGLTAAEEDEDAALLTLYREMVFLRAQAAVLLNQRGYHVSDPEQFSPPACHEVVHAQMPRAGCS